MRRKLFQGIKIGFISVLVVILVSLDNNPDNPMYYQAAFLFSMALPSIRKYLERAVMVEISKIPEANNGQPIVEPIVTPESLVSMLSGTVSTVTSGSPAS